MFYGPPEEMEDTIRACLVDGGEFDASRFGAAAMKQIMPLWMLKYLPNMSACHVGIAFNARGPNNTVVMGDVSGANAMIEAVTYLQRGIADVLIVGAGGTRISTTRMNYRGDLPIPDVANPVALSSRPHDPMSQGVVGGEGAAAVVLESEEHAQQRGVAPIARITAYASRFVPADCMRRSIRSRQPNDPGMRGSAQAIRLVIQACLADAGISPQELGLVVSHATGDPTMDAAERAAVLDTVPDVPMVATVAALGHTGAACGMIDLVTGALSLATGMAPPTLNADSIRTDMNLLRSASGLSGRHVLCLAFNSEGNASAVVLSRA
jgi:3-oxoacyl-[acyl-carrier-protein] synthase II